MNKNTKNKMSENALNWLAVGVSVFCMAVMIRLMYVVVAGKETVW